MFLKNASSSTSVSLHFKNQVEYSANLQVLLSALVG